jgi:hypothetical protein
MTDIEISPSTGRPLIRTGRRVAVFPRALRETVTAVFPDEPEVLALVEALLRQHGFDAALTGRLIAIGRGAGGAEWPLRLLAARMVEAQILALAPGDVERHEQLFAALRVDFDLRLGFTAATAIDRIAQFRARLARFAGVSRALQGLRTTPRALERFLRSARRPCRVPVARYLFSPAETVDRLYGNTRQSFGIRDRDCSAPDDVRHVLSTLPDQERAIVQALLDTQEIFWVANRTSSAINSLIEFPLGTVALTVKPPGSDLEIEIKRAGLRGPRALDVIYTRNGYVVCSSHHLQGASGGKFLEWEMDAEHRFARIWRALYGTEAPLCRTMRVNSVFKMPVPGHGEASVLRYFTSPELYGEGYPHMRAEMDRSLQSLLHFEGLPPYEAPNDMALTSRFFAATKPGQAVQVGTSAFRLDKLARFLSDDGAKDYFEDLGEPFELDRAFAFADEVLDEVITGYQPPRTSARSYAGYVAAALALPENRRSADACYLSCAEQIAKVFGTCLGLCIGSAGESFVARNVGLRNVFEEGRWQVRVLFMDHDALNIPEPNDKEIHPAHAARVMWFDYVHTVGGEIDPKVIRGDVPMLELIYRPSPELVEQAKAAFHVALESAYRAARAGLTGPLKKVFHKDWIERLSDFDEAIRTYLAAGESTEAWAESIAPLLSARRQTTQHLIKNYITGITNFGKLWTRMPYLLEPAASPDAIAER